MKEPQLCTLCSWPIKTGDKVIMGREVKMPSATELQDIGMYCGIVMHLRCYEAAGSIIAGFVTDKELPNFLKGVRNAAKSS